MTVISRAVDGGELILKEGAEAVGATGFRSPHPSDTAASATSASSERRFIMGSELMTGMLGFDVSRFPESVKARSSRQLSGMHRRSGTRIDDAHALQDYASEMNAMDVIPVSLQRMRLQPQRCRSRHTARRRDQLGQAIIHGASQRRVDPLQQMPERDRVLWPREDEYRTRGARPALLKIERGQRSHKWLGRVFHVRNAGADDRTDQHHGAERHA